MLSIDPMFSIPKSLYLYRHALTWIYLVSLQNGFIMFLHVSSLSDQIFKFQQNTFQKNGTVYGTKLFKSSIIRYYSSGSQRVGGSWLSSTRVPYSRVWRRVWSSEKFKPFKVFFNFSCGLKGCEGNIVDPILRKKQNAASNVFQGWVGHYIYPNSFFALREAENKLQTKL